MKLFMPFTPNVIAWSVRKGFWSVDLQNERAENDIAVFGLIDAEICNIIRSYEKHKDLAVLAEMPRLNRFF